MLNMCNQSSSKGQQLHNIHGCCSIIMNGVELLYAYICIYHKLWIFMQYKYLYYPPQKTNSSLALECMAFQNRSWIVFNPLLAGKLQLHSAKTCWWFAAWCFFTHGSWQNVPSELIKIGNNKTPTSTHQWLKQYVFQWFPNFDYKSDLKILKLLFF